MGTLKTLLAREDFRRRPVRALVKRVAWRLRWRVLDAPWVLGLDDELSAAVPHSGAGALIYYEGSSNPGLAALLRRVLRPGMTFFDVGAHLGEFTLRAARRVHPGGQVHAFEATPDLADLLARNVRLNALEDVHVVSSAVADRDGEVEFELGVETAMSSLRADSAPGPQVARRMRVPAVSLDEYQSKIGRSVDVVKIDVEGAEEKVLLGAKRLLALPGPSAPTLILEVSGRNYERFGTTPARVFELLHDHGYALHELDRDGSLRPLGPPAEVRGTIDVVAMKARTAP